MLNPINNVLITIGVRRSVDLGDEQRNGTDKFTEDSIKDTYRSIQDIVFEKLRDMILSGEIKQGNPMNTMELSRRLGVSRTPIREAINRLASIGLVEKIAYKGSFVRKLSVKEVIEIYYIRAALAGVSARLAIKNLTEEDKKQLLRLCEEMETAVAKKQHDLMLEKNHSLHSIIYKAAQSPRLETLVLQFYDQSEQYRALGLELPGRYEEICREHRLIVDAVVKGDKDMAEHYAREHHFNTARRIAHSVGVDIDI